MKYLVDTDTLIDYLKDRGNARYRMNQMIEAGDTLFLCAVTLAEVYSGLAPQEETTWQPFFASLPYLDISRQAALLAGKERHRFAAQGKTIAVTDALLAGLAREQHAVILTSNIKDYPTQDVRVLSLRET